MPLETAPLHVLGLSTVALAATEAVGTVADARALVAIVSRLPVRVLRPVQGAQFGDDVEQGLPARVRVD